jgi:hypothetical protein
VHPARQARIAATTKQVLVFIVFTALRYFEQAQIIPLLACKSVHVSIDESPEPWIGADFEDSSGM